MKKKILIILSICIITLAVIVFLFCLKKEIPRHEEKINNKCSKYVSEDYYNYVTIMDVDENNITIAPYNYDNDSKEEFEKYITKMKINNNIKIYNLDVSTTISNNNSSSICMNKNISKSYLFDNINSFKYNTAFIYVNDDEEINKIIFYGELINYK